MTTAARIAWAIIVASLLGWIVTFLLPEAAWVTVVRHACEGGFVGGICDAFAIGKVYRKVEDNFDSLTEAVSNTVIEDMIKPQEVVSQLQERLHEPEFALQLMNRVESVVPSRDTIHDFLDDTWRQTLQERCVHWLVHLDASATLRRVADHADEATLHKDPTLRAGVYRCLHYAASDSELAERLYQGILDRYGEVSVFEIPALPPIKRRPTPVKLESVLRRTLDPERLQQRMLKAVHSLMHPDSETESPLREVALDYARRYNDGWAQTPEDLRTLLASRLLDQLVPPLLDGIADEVWTHRNDLHMLVSEDQPLDAHPVVEYISKEVSGLLTDKLSGIDAQATEGLAKRLQGQGEKEFRAMLERRTRPQLDWIQVNGATLGLVLGTAAGIATALAH